MNWNLEHIQPGQLVTCQTTHGDFKNVDIITLGLDDSWALVSLIDGIVKPMATKTALMHRLCKSQYLPVVKLTSKHSFPEIKSTLPIVVILGLR